MKQRIVTAIYAAFGMGILILDSKTALQGAADGIKLCLQVAVPSLLPFFVLSMMLTSSLSGLSMALLQPLGRLCKIPKGSEGLLVVGFLGGYPTGAQSVALSYRSGQLSRDTARRMLGFCSNAGPAFIFGMVACRFSNWWAPWLLWAIHILSAILTGMVLPGKSDISITPARTVPVSLTRALKGSITAMANVCGWIIMFRVLMAYLDNWVLFRLPDAAQAAIAGMLELVNGCSRLDAVENTGMRFLLATGMLALGGVCVTMQTVSATEGLGMGAYLQGKLIQCAFSIVMAFGVQHLFPKEDRISLGSGAISLLPVILAGVGILFRECEKNSSIPEAVGV